MQDRKKLNELRKLITGNATAPALSKDEVKALEKVGINIQHFADESECIILVISDKLKAKDVEAAKKIITKHQRNKPFICITKSEAEL